MSVLGSSPTDIAVAALRQDLAGLHKAVSTDIEMLSGALRGLSAMVAVLVELNGGQEVLQSTFEKMQADVPVETDGHATTAPGIIVP